jgi:hypothetical protein
VNCYRETEIIKNNIYFSVHFTDLLPEFGPFCIKITKFLIAQISQQHGKSKTAPHGRVGKIAAFYVGTFFSECSGGGE